MGNRDINKMRRGIQERKKGFVELPWQGFTSEYTDEEAKRGHMGHMAV